jgi:hypothetical protein
MPEPTSKTTLWSEDQLRDALIRTGYDLEDWRFLLANFVGSRSGFAFRPLRTDASWYTKHGFLTDAQIIGHLANRYWVGTRSRFDSRRRVFITPLFAVDIDAGDDAADQRRRYEAVLKALDVEPTAVFRSSESGGFHLYFHLDGLTDLWHLRTKSGSGAVADLLGAHGIVEQNGHVEVYPRGRYRNTGPQPTLRLPFGLGCSLLNPETLEPRHADPHEDLPAVRSEFAAKAVSLVSAVDLIGRAAATRREAA